MNVLIIGFITISLLSCGKINEIKPIPTPAITFDEGVLNLLQKESNELIDQFYAIEDASKDNFRCIQQWIELTYLTASNDTIIYHFVRNRLCSVLIKSPKQIYDDVIYEFNNDSLLINVCEKQYKLNDNYIIALKRYDNGTDFLYLNDIDNEITDYMHDHLDDEKDFLNMTGEMVLLNITAGLMGKASGVRILPYYMQKGEKHKYYNDFLWI